MNLRPSALPAILATVSLLAAACGQSTQPAAQEEAPKTQLVMGLVPSGIAATILVNGQAVADYLKKETGIDVKPQVLTSYAGVIEGMTSKNIDIGWVGATAYVVAHEKNGAEPMTKSVRNGVPAYPSIIIARTDKNINELKDLKGKRFMFGDPDSTSSNIWPRYYLKQNGIDPERDFARVSSNSSQTNIALAVCNGTVDAGAMFDDARTIVVSRCRDVMTVTKKLFTAPELIPGDPQMIRKGLNSGQKDKIRKAFVKMGQDASMKDTLGKLFQIESLVPAQDSDYGKVREYIKQVVPNLLKEGLPTPSATVSASPSASR